MHLPSYLFAELPPLHSPGVRAEIIVTDFLTNHQGRDYDVPFIEQTIDKWVQQGQALYCTDRVMFTVQEQSPDTAEFHSINGGTARDLTAAVNKLLRFLSPVYTFAVTYYDNPRVNDLLKHADFSADYTQLNEGQDRTFEAKFNLRS